MCQKIIQAVAGVITDAQDTAGSSYTCKAKKSFPQLMGSFKTYCPHLGVERFTAASDCRQTTNRGIYRLCNL